MTTGNLARFEKIIPKLSCRDTQGDVGEGLLEVVTEEAQSPCCLEDLSFWLLGQENCQIHWASSAGSDLQQSSWSCSKQPQHETGPCFSQLTWQLKGN